MGSGLGLAQVYGFVKQSGGHVTIYSEIGTGTTVRIYLPRKQKFEEVEPLALRDEVPLAQADERILVVEDDEAVRNYTVTMLKDLGYSVCEAEDAAAALKLIKDQHGFNLMFTNIGLPGIKRQAASRRP